MTAIEGLLFVVALIYLVECAAWVRRNTVVFRARVRRGWRPAEALEWAGNESGGVVFAGPLPPLSPLILASLWSVSVAKNGVYSYVAQTLQHHGRPRQVERFVRWEEVDEVTFDAKEVLINGTLFCETGSELEADHVAGIILAAKTAGESERARVIRDALREMFDHAAVSARIEAFAQETANLRASCNLFALIVLALIPATLYWVVLLQRWYFVVALTLAVLAFVLLDFTRAHRKLYPERKRHRRAHFWMSLFSPLAATRARDVLARDLMVGFHPLAIAQVICGEEEFRSFARGLLADARHPMEPVCASEEEPAREAEADFRAVLLEEMERFLRRVEVKPDDLLRAPEPESDASLSYCPRCRSQYTLPQGACDACGGVRLRENGAVPE